MITNNTATRIPRTTAFESRLNTRMKFLFGADVQIGKVYKGWEDIDGSQREAPCRTLHYDGKYLYVHTIGTNNITLLSGDMADYHGTIMADHINNSYDIAKLRNRVDEYMKEKRIEEYTTEVGRHALWRSKCPSSLIDEFVQVYELMEGVDLNA